MTPERGHVPIEPGERPDQDARDARQWPCAGVAPEVQHPQPARHEEDTAFHLDLEPGGLEHLPQRAPRVALLEAVAVQPQPVECGDEQRTQERIVPVRHAQDQPATRLEDTGQFGDGRFGFVEVFDGPHRVDRVERRGPEWQTADVAHHGPQRPSIERRSRLADDRFGQVDAVDVRALSGGPLHDARVLGFVPQVGLEQRAPVERRQRLGDQPLLVFE